MARRIDKALEEKPRIAEVGLRLLGNAGKGLSKGVRGLAALHANAATPGAALKDDGIARFLGKLEGLLHAAEHPRAG